MRETSDRPRRILYPVGTVCASPFERQVNSWDAPDSERFDTPPIAIEHAVLSLEISSFSKLLK
jgi:hypothetical protein